MPARKLFDAAQQFCAQAGFPFPLASLTIRFANGSTCRVDCPHFSPTAPAAGWAFGPTGASYGGRPVTVAGKLLDVLRVLTDADEGLTAEQLKLKVWDAHTATRTVQNTVSKLRLALVVQLSLAHDPIDAHDDTYTLIV